MKRIEIDEFGPAEVMHIAEADMPEPAGDEVLIKVTAAGVNPVDAKSRKGMGFVAESVKDRMPWVPGFDIAGTVVKCGPDAKELEEGDRVFGRLNFQTRTGGYSEYTVESEKILAKAPEFLDLLYTAGLPVAGLTAWQSLFTVGSVQEGDRVLIHAAAGGVGHLAVQFAKMKGAHVICTASEYNRSFLMEMGADEVIDYKKNDFTKAVEPVDFILDNMGFEVGERSLDVLKPDGMMVTVPTVTAERVCEAGSARGLNVQGIKVQVSKADLTTIAELVDKGFVRVFISQIYPLEQAVQAHKDIESGATRGKIVLAVG